jgi:ADP-L-glycero-D-manno-heptose 6-epimerase
VEKNNKYIVLTGAAGFIGSCMLRQLNDAGYERIIIVDDFSKKNKNVNFENKKFSQQIDRAHFITWFRAHSQEVALMLHLGARTDTTEKSWEIFLELNVEYSKNIWHICTEAQIPLIYASSAATYGLGELGYDDTHNNVSQLRPLNPYGDSKNEFDKWVLSQNQTPPSWYALKFFNVYGPNEYHKGRMASVIFHTCRTIKTKGTMQLFRSHRSDFKDGEQSRDFIYVKDVVKVLLFLAEQRPENGIYNLGTGKARTFVALATQTFNAMQLKPAISFIDTPEDIRATYQYFTEANMQKLWSQGYNVPFYTLEDGINDYVQHYLLDEKIW